MRHFLREGREGYKSEGTLTLIPPLIVILLKRLNGQADNEMFYSREPGNELYSRLDGTGSV